MGGIVLAGGKSSRMGQDKALLPFGQTTLLAHVVETVQAIAGSTLVVADTADKYVLPDVRVIGDIYPGTGPLGGIVTGLSAAGGSYHLVAACDMPHLKPVVLQLLLRAADGHDGAIPEIGGQLEPLCAVYHSRCANRLIAALEQGQLAVHQAVRTLNLKRVGESALRRLDPDLITFTNLNNPEDLRKR